MHFNFPIVCVGNLSTGGTGKTPHVDYLIHLLKNDYAVGVMSRGYRRNTRGFVEVSVEHKAKEVGDEALLTKWKHPDIAVAVSESRALGIPDFVKDKDENFVLLLDDGFQHRAVRAGLNIILTPYHDLYINNELLPFGNLREFKSGAKRADIIVVSHCPEHLNKLEKETIKAKLNLESYQHLFFSFVQYLPYYQVFQGAPKAHTPSKESSILLVTGIASNEKMKMQIEANFEKVYTRSFSDHHHFDQQDIESIITSFKNIDVAHKYLITTEKDLTRLSPFAEEFNKAQIPVLCLPIKINFAEEERMKFNKAIRFYLETSFEENLTV